MKQFALALLVIIATATFALSADARRLGGGGSLGAQRSAIAPKPPAAAPGAAAQPVMPAQPGAAAAAKPALPATPAAASGMSRWMGPIAGIAAGLGIAALLSHFGLPEGLGSFLLLGLLAVAIVFVVRMFLARRNPASAPMQYAGASGPPNVGRTEPQLAANWGAPKQEPVMAPAAGAPPSGSVPPGFDAEGFARQAKLQFNRLQAAYDSGDRQTMSQVMTPEMFAEATRELNTRGEHRPTEIVSLNAGVLEVATEGANHWASVRYTGLLREDGDSTAKPIDEVWNLTKPVDGSSGWMLAGIQQTA